MLDDKEAARQLEQAVLNLPRDYPFREEALRACGRLILGRLGESHPYILHLHEDGLKTLE